MIIFNVVATLPCSTLIFSFWTINVGRYARILLLSLLFYFFHFLNDTKFEHVTSTYYHSWYLVFGFTFNVNYLHRVIDTWCMCLYLVYQTLNILFSAVDTLQLALD